MEKILDTLKQTGFDFKKKFGQNFITDINLLDAIVLDAEIGSQDEVLEIGTGAGTLTKAIAKKCKKVVSLEIDNSLREYLYSAFNEYSNINLFFADFMKVSPQEVNKQFDGAFKVVANLPYYITTPIITRLIKEKYNVKSITIMVQKEVADRLVSESGTKDYGAITVWLDSIANVKLKRIVNKKMFTPMPKVDSAIVSISLNRKKYNIKNYPLHEKVIESAFSMRRKTLVNCLKAKLSLSQEQIEKVFDQIGLHIGVRGEVLSTEQFVALSNAICDLY